MVDMLSFLSSLPFSVLRILGTEANKFGSDDLLKSPKSPLKSPKSPLNLLKSGLMVYIVHNLLL